MITHYKTISSPSTSEFKDRGSKFIAYAYPVNDKNDFKEKLAAIKKEHPKATHHCFAYRLGVDGTEYRVSDDGEPSGTAGRPMLGQIDSKQLTNILIIVVRYFGGTQLGIPGLINAYKTATATAIESTSIVEKPILVNYSVEFDYTRMHDVMKIIKQFDCVVLEQDIKLFCSINVAIPGYDLENILQCFNEIYSVEVKKIS
jgi:uncharacterized YigZ family protein